MTYAVTEQCIACKHMDCVSVCPVDCFHEGENMLVIHPDECIDRGACEPECRADAIKPALSAEMGQWAAFNLKYAALWLNIAEKGTPRPDATAMQGVPNMLATLFSERPGAGS